MNEEHNCKHEWRLLKNGAWSSFDGKYEKDEFYCIFCLEIKRK